MQRGLGAAALDAVRRRAERVNRAGGAVGRGRGERQAVDSARQPGQPGAAAEHDRNPATGASSVFYYVDSAGYLTSRKGADGKPVRLELIGTGLHRRSRSRRTAGTWPRCAAARCTRASSAARLTKRGSGFVAMSWDVNDDLWTSLGAQIVMFRVTVTIRQPLGQLVPCPSTWSAPTGSRTERAVHRAAGRARRRPRGDRHRQQRADLRRHLRAAGAESADRALPGAAEPAQRHRVHRADLVRPATTSSRSPSRAPPRPSTR